MSRPPLTVTVGTTRHILREAQRSLPFPDVVEYGGVCAQTHTAGAQRAHDKKKLGVFAVSLQRKV